MAYSTSELILNPDGSVYHLGLKGEDIPNLIFTVGDPDRVAHVAKHLDRIDWQKNRREFTMVRGAYNGTECLIMSTGMGTDNIDIVWNELDAAVNINPKTRQDNAQRRNLIWVRIGTSGAIRNDIPLGTHLYSSGALSFDGLLPFYQHSFEKVDLGASAPIAPYWIPLPQDAPDLPADVAMGITATLPGFYGPQGRTIRTQSSFTAAMDQLQQRTLHGQPITNFEMETAGIFALAHLLGHQAHSFSALLANRAEGTFHNAPEACVDELIKKVLTWAASTFK